MVLISASPAAVPNEPAPNEAAAEPVSLALSNTLETIELPAPETVSADSVAPPEPIEEVATAAKSFGWAPIATTAVSLLSTVAILAVWYSVGGPDATPPPVAQAEASQQAETVTPPETEPPTVTPVPAQQPAEESAAEPDPAPVSVETTPIEPLDPPAETPPPPPAERVALALHEEPPRTVATIELAPEIDPLDFDPTEVELVLRKGPTEPAEPPTEPVRATPPAVPPAADLDAQLAAAGRQAGIFVRRGPTDDTTGPAVGSAEKALAFVLPEVALKGIPLDAALELIGNLAGVPITIEPQALRRSGITANRPVDVIAEGESLATILRATLKQVRLDYRTEGPHITVVRAGTGKERTITHRLADLARNDPEGFTALLRRFVPLEDDFELDHNGELTLTADVAKHYDLLVFCERLRVARGLPTDSKYPRDLLVPESSLAQLNAKLQRRTTFSFVEPTPLAEVFDHWRRVTDLSVLVDWRALADVGLGPQSTIECSVTNRPWQTALDGVLEPLGLTWAAVNGNALAITTRHAAEPLVTTEMYPAGRSTAESLAATLTEQHPKATIAFCQASNRLLLRGEATAQRAAWKATADR